jgi:hypothetical protein
MLFTAPKRVSSGASPNGRERVATSNGAGPGSGL